MSAAAIIGALRVNLGLDSAQFTSGVKQVQSSMGNLGKALGVVSGVAAAVGAAMVAITAPTAKAAAEMTRLAQVANTTPEALQRWAAGSRTVGIEQEKLADILKDTNDRVGDFLITGGGPMADFFEQIAPKVGITADAFRGLSGPEALQLYVSSLEKAGASQQQMTFFMEAMASDSTLLLPLLRNNGAEMERLGDAAASLGGVLGNEAVAALTRAHLALADVATAAQGARDRIASELAPAVEAMAVAFTNSMREGGALNTALDGVAAVAGAASTAIQLVVENFDRLAVYAGVAAAGLTVAFAPAIAAATLAAGAFVAKLVLTRAALIRTGIGAMVVVAGELVYQLLRLVEATGGWGKTMELLGRVASGVWDGIKTSASSIGPALGAVWETVKAGFFSMIEGIASLWRKFLGNMATDLAGLTFLPGMEAAYESVGNAAITAGSAVYEFRAAAETARDNAAALKEEASSLASEGFASAVTAAKELSVSVTETGDAVDSVVPPVAAGGAALEGLGAAAGGAAEKLTEMQKAAEAWKDRIKTPVEGYRDEVAKLDKLLAGGLINADDYRRAMEKLNEELANGVPMVNDVANAFGDFIVSGLRNFKDFASSILDSFKSMISGMIATAARNQIMIGMGITGGGVAGAAGAAAGVPAGMGGMGGLGGILGGIAGVGSSFLSGASGLLTSLTGAGGGLSAAGTYLSSVLGGATASIGGFAAAAGALLGPIGLVAGAFSFFRTKTKLLDQGLRITLDGMDGLVETFKKVEKSRFFGLSKSRSTSTSPADSAVAGPILQAIGDIQAGVMAAAEVLGVGARAFDGFSASISFSTKGLSDSEIADKLAEKMGELGDSFAAMALSGMPQLIKLGEGAADALGRLSTALSSANVWMDRLGKTLFASSLAGGGRASDFADVLGGSDAMNTAVSAYYGAFYSDGERLAQARKELGEALNLLGINTLPGSNRDFRALVDQAFGAGDNTLAAKLIALAPAMAEITGQTQSLTNAMKDLDRQSLFRTSADALYASTSEGFRASSVNASDAETRSLLAEVVKAIREGDINNARLTARLVALQERASLDPNGAAA